jgi:hypothetical protein
MSLGAKYVNKRTSDNVKGKGRKRKGEVVKVKNSGETVKCPQMR